MIVVECTERISHGAVEEGCRGLPIQPAIDTASDALEVAGIGQLVQSVGFPEPRGRSAGLHRLLKQARLMQKVKAESSTTSKMVVVASNLNESVSLPPRPRSASCLRRGYAQDDSKEKFVADFVAAWTKVMNADMFI